MDTADEWLRVVDAARLLGESPATVRRHVQRGRLRGRSRHGGRSIEVDAPGVWELRAGRLSALGITRDPLRADTDATDPLLLVARLVEVEASRARLAAQVELLRSELGRVSEALTLAMAADDVSEDRAKTWKSVARALASPTSLGDEILRETSLAKPLD